MKESSYISTPPLGLRGLLYGAIYRFTFTQVFGKFYIPDKYSWKAMLNKQNKLSLFIQLNA